MQALGQVGDVLLAISTSVNSTNCIRALELAHQLGIHTVGYTGNGGAMKVLCEINVIIPSKITMHIQESYLALEHVLCMAVEQACFGREFGIANDGVTNRVPAQ